MSFAGIARIENTSDFYLPRRNDMTKRDEQALYQLQRRKHLEMEKTERNKDGDIVRIIQPLSSEERAQMDEWEQKVRLGRQPRVGDVEYMFAPRGKTGSIWLMPAGHASLLGVRWPELRPMPWSEPMPPGVELRQPSRVPSANMITYGSDSPDSVDPFHQASSMQRAPIQRDGMTAPATDALGGVDSDQINQRKQLLDPRPDVYPGGRIGSL